MVAEYLDDENKENLSKVSLFMFWSMWDISTCYWYDREKTLEDYDVYIKDDFVPICWFPHPNKCYGGCLGLPWHMMCNRCQDYEHSLDEEYHELSFWEFY